ncbi:unnamed protein product [Mucor circinelloides]|uniref:Splicing factor U2AF subunit n=1 Tax=Mucor circinelloides f. circinelloides (strain 1006PhL) TaxID=1220926 RepID=S2JT49_MUCC1|nr:hypothetical protein HMPREF1544_10300 [Mucor circinelloides 1006PhL]KAG1118325.1 hypothetical protein G6F42_013226 [Rhizopus arrhizus]
MSYGWNRDSNSAPQQSAADLASSFLNSVGQELHGASNENPYGGHEAQGRYGEEMGYHGGNDDYRSSRREGGGGGDMDRGNRDGRHSRDRYHDRSRDNRDSRRRRSRDRRERSPRDRHHGRSNRDDRDYRSSRRRRSPSPRRSSRRRSPSSRRRDDENVIPLSKREKKLHNWDMAPAGMEGMSAEQVKSTGLFPLPGQVVGTRTPQSFQPPPPSDHMMHDGSRIRVTQGAAGPVALNATLARQAKRLYVGQIPFGIDEKPMADFFNETMEKLHLADTTPVLAVQINHDKNYAFVEFQTPEQATSAMAFDGIMFQGQQLKIRRPKDYQAPVDGEYGDMPNQLPGLVSTNVPDTPNKIFIGGLPVYLNDDQVVELLKSFGELRAFNLVKDPVTGANKGFAFCEYADPSVTDLACQGLNNMELGDRKLVVQRASVGAKHGLLPTEYATGQLPLTVADYLPISSAKEEEATRVLQLMNMVTPDELEDDEEYKDIWDDIAEECSKFGTIIDMKIPRPSKGTRVPGCGLIFVRYEDSQQTLAALRSLAGRKFADRTVVATFIDEENYLSDNF